MSGYVMPPDLARIIGDLSTRLGNLERTRTIPTGTDAPTTAPADGAQYGDTTTDLYWLRLGGAWESVQMGQRTVRGTVTAAGVITFGTGFSVVKNATGDYTVTFDTPFASPPSGSGMVAGTAGGLAVKQPASGVWTAAACQFVVFATATGTATDGAFHFIVAGDA